MERFSVSRVSDKNQSKNVNNSKNEVALNVGELNGQGNTDITNNDRRKFSLAQLTR